MRLDLLEAAMGSAAAGETQSNLDRERLGYMAGFGVFLILHKACFAVLKINLSVINGVIDALTCCLQAMSSSQKRSREPYQWVKTIHRYTVPGKRSYRLYFRLFSALLEKESLLAGEQAFLTALRCVNVQVCPYNLYAEQLSGTSFTMPRR